MLSNAQNKAVDRLFEVSHEEVCAGLRVKRETLDSWMRDPEFQQAVQERMKGYRQAARRILSRVYLDACLEMGVIIHSDDKNKHKLIVDILKASGLLKEDPDEEPVDPIASLIAQISQREED